MYETSTQFRFWMFSRTRLEELRKEVNTKAREEIKIVMEKEEALTKSQGKHFPEVQYLSEPEERILCKYIENKVIQMGKFLKYPINVTATAVTLFKRFYLTTSVMEYPPNRMLLVAIFIATKVEERYISLQEFIKILKDINVNVDPQVILDLEVQFFNQLQFQLIVFHPFPPLYGYYLKALQKLSNTQITQKQLKAIRDLANEKLEKSLLTDLCFLFHPQQISLCCFKMSAEETLGKESEEFQIFERFLITELPTGSTLKDTKFFTDIAEILSVQDHNDDEMLIKKFQAKLASSHNPAKNPNSEYYKYMQQEKEKAESEKRKRKLEEINNREAHLIQKIDPDESFELMSRGIDVFQSPSKKSSP